MRQPLSAPNGRKNRPLTPRQEAAAFSLATGRTLREAAAEAGCGERTIRTWQTTLPAFGQRITALRAEATSRALGHLVRDMAGAARTLGLLSRRGRSEAVRLAAARSVLELGTRLREHVELEERLAALEEAQDAGGRRAGRVG
jgi:hypothetical protein